MHNYTVSDGLPSNEIYDIFCDSKGFLWFASDAGVSRYDGYRFTNFTSRDGLPDNAIFGFFEDSHGRIWFRSYSGLLCYYEQNKIVAPAVNAQLKKMMNGQMALSLYVDRGDTVWIGAEGERALIRVLPGFQQVDNHYRMTDHCLDIRETEPGIFLFSNKMIALKPGTISFTAYGQKKSVAAGSMKSNAYGLYCVRLNAQKVIFGFNDRHYEIEGTATREIRDTLPVIRFVSRDANSYWSCHSRQRGVQLITVFPDGTSRPEKRFLAGYSVTDCQTDHEGGTWFTTLERGVFYMPYSEIEMFDPGLATGEKINSLVSYHGSPAAGTSLGKVSRINGEDLDEIIYRNRPAYISCLFATSNKLFVCAQTNSQLYDAVAHTVSPVTDSTGTFPVYSASWYDPQSFCAVGVRTAYRISAQSGKPQILYRLLPERMRSICRGNGDTLWMGGLSGLWMFAPGKDPVNMSSVDPLLGERIDFLYYDSLHNRLWMSSKGAGLLMKEGSLVRDFSNEQPLIAATCRAVSADAGGNIWVATNGGAFCVSFESGKFRVTEFSKQNGLPSNDIVGIVREADTVWMASPDHVFRFRLSEYPHNKSKAPLWFSNIRVHGRGTVIADSVFSYAENTITFSFTGLSYKSFGQVHYRFRLLGADSAWKETESNELSFYSLPPGEYTFCLYALNNDGVASAPLEYHFLIESPFWKRWWFIGFVSLVLIAAILFLFRFRLRQVRQKELFNQRLVEMEMTALRAQMNPHFIFNAINSIHNFVLQGDKNSSATYLSKFSRLIRNVLENSGQKQITLAREIETLGLYIEIEQMRFSDGFSYEIETGPSLELSKLTVVPLLLQPYVENAIWHGLLHKKGKGHLRIVLAEERDMIRCEIDDDGIGREEAAQYRQQRNTGRNSMGGDISLRRLKLLNDLYGMNFSRTYTDKKNTDGTPAGTKVVLLIPKIYKEEN